MRPLERYPTLGRGLEETTALSQAIAQINREHVCWIEIMMTMEMISSAMIKAVAAPVD